MDRSNFARNTMPNGSVPIGSLPMPPGRSPSKGNFSAPTPGRVSSEHAWANAHRAWMIACRLAASRR